MVMKAILDTLDDQPEVFKEHYVQRDGKFYLETDTLRTQADVDRIQSSLTKERLDHKQLKDRYAPLSTVGLEMDEIVNRVARFPELEIASKGKIDETKLEEIVQGRIKTVMTPVERELTELRTGVQERDGIIGTYKERDRINTIHDAIRAAATKAGVSPTAVDDALIIGERMFDIDETGRVVTKEGNGVTQNIDAATWLAEMQPKRPHWWPLSQGGGSGGGKNGNSGGANPWSAEHWNMTEQGKIFQENPTQAANMARLAGTSIGGRKPAPRK
jgi:hypothetical protein